MLGLGVVVATDGGPNSPVFNLDHSALEKNIAAIFNKVAHSSATTKRSVPAYEAQMSASTTLSTVPSPLTTTVSSTTARSVPPTTTYPSILRYPLAKSTVSPTYRELPSYAPPSRALFTPPLPPEYVNPFADKPTLRGTNSDSHTGVRRPIPPPSLTPAHERIPIRPPDLVQNGHQDHHHQRNKSGKAEQQKQHQHQRESEHERDRRNNTGDFMPTLHHTSISRILSGSNGRKQDIPDVLLKPLPSKAPVGQEVETQPPPSSVTTTTAKSTSAHPTHPTIFNLPNTRRNDETENTNEEDDDEMRREPKNNNAVLKTETIEIVDAERLPYPQPQPPAPSKEPMDDPSRSNGPHATHSLESSWRIAWSLHVYLAAILFTLMALYSIYKIVRFNDATNLLTQSYFLTVHLLLTTVCTLRCFHLFYDAYNLGHSLPEPLSRILMHLPAPLLSTAFATLVLYLARYSEAPALRTRLLSPGALILASTIHVVLCLSLHTSSYVIGYRDDARILPLICQCIYILVCVTVGLCYMYVYRVVRTHIHIMSSSSVIGGKNIVGSHTGADPTLVALSTAITTSIASALLFILMGFVQLYGVFGVPERPYPYPWLWWGWQFSVRLLELSMCALLAWVASLSQYPMREKQMHQQAQPHHHHHHHHAAHSGFALFPCGSSTSTENMDDVLYPAICSTNQAIQNYTMRTGKHVYDDSFPLNTLPEHLNISGTFERHSIRKSGTVGHFPYEGNNRGSLSRQTNSATLRANSEMNNSHAVRKFGLVNL